MRLLETTLQQRLSRIVADSDTTDLRPDKGSIIGTEARIKLVQL